MALQYKNGAVIITNIPTTYNFMINSGLFVQGAWLDAVAPPNIFGKVEINYDDLTAPQKATVDDWILNVVVPALGLIDDSIAKIITLTSQLATSDAYAVSSVKNQFISCKKNENNKEVSAGTMFRYSTATVPQQTLIDDLFTLTVDNLSV